MKDSFTITKSDNKITIGVNGKIGIPDEKEIDISGYRERGKFKAFYSNNPFCFGDIVVTGMSSASDPMKYVGRLVQVREGVGSFGSNQYIIRHPDGSLEMHENQSLWVLCQKDRNEILSKYYNKELLDIDSEEHEYSIKGKYPETGFYIEQQGGDL